MIVRKGAGAYRLVYTINLFLTYYKLLLQFLGVYRVNFFCRIIHGKFDSPMQTPYTIKKLV